jgi:hypothetical protein
MPNDGDLLDLFPLMIEDETPRGRSFMSFALTGRHAREIRRVLLAMLEEAGEATEDV